jgi:hypothetical protein
MNPKERKIRLDLIADRLMEITRELDMLNKHLEMDGDQKTVQSIITDLHWAAEHCTTIGLHQIGKALKDKCGYE